MLTIGGGMVQAQATLSPGDVVGGTIAAGAVDRWSFRAVDGQLLSFVVRAVDPSLDPVITIQDSNANDLIRNDDYDYPNSRDAMIEGFSAPRLGTYTLLISGYGESQGAYDLEVHPGYSAPVMLEGFEDWSLVDFSDEQSATLEASEDALVLGQEGIGVRALALGDAIVSTTYYAEIDFVETSGTNGWRVALLAYYQDDENYAYVGINHQGLWRVVEVVDAEELVLRDWGSHPAIRTAPSDFTLGVLVNERGLDIFYNRQYIGNELLSGVPEGNIAVEVQTTESLGSAANTRVSNIYMTVPADVSDGMIFPQHLVAVNSTYTVRELERRNVIPAGGEMVLNIPESFAQNVVAGVSRFPLASDSTFTNFVLGATVSWRTMGAGLSGCGLIVRDSGSDDQYALAFVDNAGGYGIAKRDGDAFVDSLYGESIPLGNGALDLLLVGIEDELHYFVEGIYAGTIAYPASAGGIGEAVVNFDNVDSSCRFDNLWLWNLD